MQLRKLSRQDHFPGIYTSHVGYLPAAQKIAVVADRYPVGSPFVIRCCDSYPPDGTPIVLRGTLEASPCVWGDYSKADFSKLSTSGFFQLVIGSFNKGVDISEPHCSYPFLVADGVYVKTLRMAFDYFTHQRCGVQVPGYHPACHLDDAIFRDGGEYRDTSGGWHDAGDVRKWLHYTQMYIYSLLQMHERLAPPWYNQRQPWDDVLDEARWGNDYQLKMIDATTGEVFHDVGGGVNGDNDDCRWTDNQLLSGDERRIAHVTGGSMKHQWWFVATQARMSRAFTHFDPPYANHCMNAAILALKRTPSNPSGNLSDDTLGSLAGWELYRATGEQHWLDSACAFAKTILDCQSTRYECGQRKVRGYLYANREHSLFQKETAWSGLPLCVLCNLNQHLPGAVDAVRMLLEDYLLPLAALNPFGIIPYGLYARPLAGEGVAHPLAGQLSYRYFAWREATSAETAAQETETFQHGLTSNQLSYAVGLMAAEKVLGNGVAQQLALRQLEWVMGANTHAACLMTDGGVNTPYPYSPFVGLIPGGMMNGFIGNAEDVPYLHAGNTLDWNTNEYWGTHSANYLWTLALLYQGTGVTL